MKKRFIASLLMLVILIGMVPIMTATTSANTIPFDYRNPITRQGSIYFDEWTHSQHRGEFLDKDGTAFKGVGMHEPNGRSGTSFVTYNIPESAGQFTAFISLDSGWCGTASYGTTTFQVLFDGVSVFSQSYTETFSAEFINIEIPQNSRTITLQVQQAAGRGGNHAAFFGTLNFTQGTSTPQPETEPTIQNPHSAWARAELEAAQAMGIIPPLLAKPEVDLREPITRVEFAGVVVLTYEILAGTRVSPAPRNPFTDTRDIYALMAFNEGLMVGTASDKFAPDMILNRETAATALTRVFKKWHFDGWSFATDANFPLSYTRPAPFADDANISGWAKDSVYFMAANGIIQGIGNNRFAPKNMSPYEESVNYANATREQAIIIAYRMVENMKK